MCMLSACVLLASHQILALHLLRAVLPSWEQADRARDMEGLVRQLFGFLGGLLTTCSSDVPLLRGGLSLFLSSCLCPRRMRRAHQLLFLLCLTDPAARRQARPQASLTATHSSTLAEEAVALLRALHRLGQWRGLVNAHINARLRAAARGAEPSGVGAPRPPCTLSDAYCACRLLRALTPGRPQPRHICVSRPWWKTRSLTLRPRT